MIEAEMARGDELLLVIAEYADLEWKKCRHRAVNIVMKDGRKICEDHSGFPPFTMIRFRSESQSVTNRLKAAISEYKGLVLWHMFSQERLVLPGRNWVIRPMFVDELESQAKLSGARDLAHFIERKYSNLSKDAYFDLTGLAKYVKSSFELDS